MPAPDLEDHDITSYSVIYRQGVHVRITRDGRHAEGHSHVSEHEAFHDALALLDEHEANDHTEHTYASTEEV